MAVIINSEKYGQYGEFESLEEAQETIRACGGEFESTELREEDRVVLDEEDDPVGYTI